MLGEAVEGEQYNQPGIKITAQIESTRRVKSLPPLTTAYCTIIMTSRKLINEMKGLLLNTFHNESFIDAEYVKF